MRKQFLRFPKKLRLPNAGAVNIFRMRSVGSKIFLLFFASILAFVIVLGTVSYQISTKSVKDKSAKGIGQTILQASQKLDLLFGLYEGVSNKVVTEPDVKTNAEIFFSGSSTQVERNMAESKILTTIRNSRFSTPGIESTALIAADTRQVLLDTTNAPQKIDGNPAWLDEIVKGDGKLVWLDSTPKGFITNVSKPVFGLGRLQKNYYAGGSKAVICLIEIAVDALTEQLKTVDIGQTGQVVIVNKDRRIEQSPTIDNLGKELALADAGSPLAYQKGPDGTQVISAAYTSAKTGWNVVGYTLISELTRDTRTIYWVTVGMAVVAVLFAVVIGGFAVRMFGRPLVELRNIMKIAESGNLLARTNFRRKDEIAELGESFNGMMVKFTSLIVKTNESAQHVLSMAKELLSASRHTEHSAGEIEAVMKETALGAAELSAVIEKSSLLTVEMHEKLESVVESSGKMEEISGQVEQSSEQGNGYLKEVLAKTNSANTLTEELFHKVNGLQSGAQSIRKVLDMLKNIAQQTNILSLNAGIEAARAGAAGKGFMVISSEIRKLADQSKQSIDEVSAITKQIQHGVGEAVDALNKAYPVFKEQIGIVEQTDSLFNRVSGYMADYRSQLTVVTGSISVLRGTQQSLVDGMSQVSATSEESAASTEQVAALSSVQLDTSRTMVALSEDMEKLSIELERSLALFTI